MNNIGKQIDKLRNIDGEQTKFKDIAKTVNALNGTSYKTPSIRRMYYEWKASEAIKVKTLKRDMYQDNVQLNIKNPRILVIPDVHFPFVADGFLEFLDNTKSQYGLDTIICIGDILDMCAISAWESDPDGMSADSELIATIPQLIAMADMFPEMYITIGNHDARPQRMARKAGIPTRLLRHFNEVIENITEGQANVDGWHWNNSYILNENTLIEHGNRTGLTATYKKAVLTNFNVIQGHTHSYASVMYANDGYTSRWAMNVGAGIDHSAYAFAYAKAIDMSPTLGCGIVVDGIPQIIPFNG